MEQIISIIVSVALSVTFYVWCLYVLRLQNAQRFVRGRPYLSPNAICYWRAGLALFAFFLYFWTSCQSFAIFIFSFAAVLDGVDGEVARKCNLGTEWGKSLDPLCDKITYLPPLFMFSWLGIMDLRLVTILIAIELFGQFFTRLLLARLSRSVAANNFGKIKAIICFGLVIYCACISANSGLFNFCDQLLVPTIILAAASIAFKFIPNRWYANILSLLNLGCGIISLELIFNAHIVMAIIAIIMGQVFDLFDGRMAQKHGGTPFGPYLDDIADFVSFGMCPALIIYFTEKGIAALLGGVFLSCVLFRLVRFVARDKKRADLPQGIFNGLPSPAGALLVVGAALMRDPVILLSVTAIAALLMVSHVRFAHFGRVMLKKIPKQIFFVFGTCVIVALAYIAKTHNAPMFGYVLLLSTAAYLVLGNRMAKAIF